MQKIIKLNLGLSGDQFMVKNILGKGKVNKGETLIVMTNNKEEEIEYASSVSGINFYPLISIGDKISSKQDIYSFELYDNDSSRNYIDNKIWDLAIATNAVFKGLLGSMGQSGQIAARTYTMKVELPVKNGVDALIDSISNAMLKLESGEELEDGDVVVIAEKPFAVAQKRLLPISYIYERDPKKMEKSERIDYLKEVSKLLDTPVVEEDLILADAYTEDPELGMMCTMGAFNHTLLAYLTAEKIKETTGKTVDVIISDTDTGIDVRKTIIGCITLGSTPIGATKGLTLYECMRASCAAEFSRGSTQRTPIVVCKPADRCRIRPDIGEHRGYDGKLSFSKEGKIAFD